MAKGIEKILVENVGNNTTVCGEYDRMKKSTGSGVRNTEES